jgi:hypothetical protein
VVTGADRLAIEAIEAELHRAARYDDESIAHSRWVHQRYACGCYPSLVPARQATVRTAWHEAGHAVAALAVGAQFTSASIHHGHRSEGRVHGISGAHEYRFVIDAAGQIAERLMNWTMLERDDDLRSWLPTWRQDGGDARRFRQSIASRYGGDEAAAWRYSATARDTPARQGLARPSAAPAVQRGGRAYAVVKQSALNQSALKQSVVKQSQAGPDERHAVLGTRRRDLV